MSISRNTTYNIVGSALPILLSLATVPAYIKLIGVDRYGVLAIAWLLLGYFGLFDLGLGRATMHRIASLKHAPAENRLRTLHNAITVNLGMGLMGGALLWGASSYFFAHQFKIQPDLLTEMLFAAPLLALSVPIATLTGVLTGGLQGCERFRRTNVISVVSTALFQIAPLAVAWLSGPNISVLLGVAIATRLLSVIILWIACVQEFGGALRFGYDRIEAKALFKFGGWVTITSIISPLIILTDRFAIGAMVGVAAVAYYSIPYQLTQRAAIFPAALANAIFPRLASVQDSEDENRISVAANMVLSTAMTFPVLIGIFSIGPFIKLWLGSEFAENSSVVAQFLIVGFWFNAFAMISYIRLQAKGRPEQVAFVLLVELIPYLLALYFGLKFFGILGCAAAFAARCALDFLLLSFVAGRETIAWGAIFRGACLLILGLTASHIWSVADIAWWIAAIVLLIAAAADAWLNAPDILKLKLNGARMWFRRT